MKCVILESPFSGDIETHIIYGRRCMTDCLNRGEAPMASHLLYTQPGVLDDTIQSERDKGMLAGWTWIPVASRSVIYTDYGVSSGMKEGIIRAINANLDIEFRTIGRNDARV